MKKVFLKRSLDEKIAQLKKEYPSVNEIDYKKDIDWEKIKMQGVKCILNESREIAELYKIKEKIDIDNLEVLYGNKEFNDGKMLVYSEELYTTLGYITNHSSILITKNFNLKKDNVIYIKLNKTKREDYIYFRFLAKEKFHFFKKMYIENTLIDTTTYLDIYIGNNRIGYALKKGNKVLFDYNMGITHSNNIEVVFDLNDRGIKINNHKFFISQFIINKYIKNKAFVIMSGALNKSKYELCDIEFGTKDINVKDILVKKDKNILFFKDELYFYRREKNKL